MKAYVYNKDYLKVRKGLKVLEVGPGNNPTKRADVLIEKFVQDNTHRRGDLKIFKHQKLVQADGENIPFKNGEFDFVVCSHVIEHTNNPVQFMEEQFRVAGRGYLEAPSLFGEFLATLILILCFLVGFVILFDTNIYQIITGDDGILDDFLCFNAILFGQMLAVLKSRQLGIHPDNPVPSGTVNRVVQGVAIYPYDQTEEEVQ